MGWTLKKTKSTLATKKKKKKRKIPSVIEIIDEVALEGMQERPNFFRPSMLYNCDRENVFHYVHAPAGPQKVGPRLRRILDNGTAVHDLIQDRYLPRHPEYWFVKEPKVSVNIDGFLIRGSCDGVLIRRKDFLTFGIELKTIAKDSFKRLTKPKTEHVFQARLYMEMQNLPAIVVVYWNKDNQTMKEYVVYKDSKCWDEVTERINYLGSFVEKKKLPMFDKATCNKTFCRYVKECRKAGAPV